MEEDLGARFNHKGKKIYKSKKKKREAYHRNNARNRDQYGISKATGRIVDVSTDQAYEQWEDEYTNNNYENDLIEQIDTKKKSEDNQE